MKQFYNLLINTLIANVTTSFLWFALTFWAYLETRSVLATSIIGGSYMLMLSITGVPFGTLVDKYKKKTVMVVSTLLTVAAYLVASLQYVVTPESELLRLGGLSFWVFVVVILAGASVEGIRNVALSTCVTIMVPKEKHAKANGLVGSVAGLAFAVTSVFSGLVVGMLGMGWALGISVALTAVSLVHLMFVKIPEEDVEHDPELTSRVDFKGSWRAIIAVPGLVALILFTTFNNLLGGVFMSLMDPYGLNLVSVEVWGIIWGVLSLSFTLGGLAVATWGLTKRPLRLMLLVNLIMWFTTIFFTIRESIVLMVAGIFVYMSLFPVIEAAEQTIIQRVVPLQKQGRVFGFAQSVEAAAAPITAFLIGPIAEFIIIPYMNSTAGQNDLGWLLGAGNARGIALVFVVSGLIGVAITTLAFTTKSYRQLSAVFAKK